MNPVFFGSSARQLYGVYHPPRGRATREAGVVLCPAIGQEYMRTHRALRQLALQLSKVGQHVLRFDYFGTGDSAGETTEADLGQWHQDVGAAVEELRDTSGLERISLVGIRLGAALAVTAAAGRSDVDRVVLWDPVVQGQRYLDDLLARAEPSRNGSTPDVVGVTGFPLTRRMREELAGVDLLALAPPAGRPMLAVVSEDRPEYRALAERWAGHAAGFRFQCLPSAGDWDDAERAGAALLPQQIIQEIVTSLSQGG